MSSILAPSHAGHTQVRRPVIEQYQEHTLDGILTIQAITREDVKAAGEAFLKLQMKVRGCKPNSKSGAIAAIRKLRDHG